MRTIRYWSEIGAAPPAGRSDGGHRLYDARAVLSAVARLRPDTEEMTLMNELTRLSATERAQIIDDFIADVFDGLDPSPKLKAKLRLTTLELPEEPTPDQVAAWVELAELVQDPGFRQRMRAMAECHGDTHAGHRPEAGLGGFTRKVTSLVGPARERGVAPDSPEAGQILDRLLDRADAGRRAYIRERVAAGAASQSDRYHELLAVLNGERARPSRVADLEWLLVALDSQPT